MADATYKQNDVSPDLIIGSIKNGDGTFMNLSGATVKFHMRKVGASTALVTHSSTSTSVSSTGSTTAGYDVTVRWSTGDLATNGEYEFELDIVLASGKRVTVPNNKWFTLEVKDDIA